MTSVITLAPIAMQLARSVSLDALFPSGAVESMLRDNRARAPDFGDTKLPKEIEPFLGHYFVLVRAASQLLNVAAFDGLAQFHEDVEEEYMPGGPPQSPVYDSFAMQFVLGAVPQGIGNETPYSVLARLLLRDPSRARFQALAQSLAEARFELCRVKSARDFSAEVELVRSGGMVSVSLTGPFLRSGDFALLRILQFDGSFFIAESPYLLKASEQDWREHLARVVANQAGPSKAATPRKDSKLSSKEQARLRQKEKAKASRSEPEEVIKRYLQFGSSPRHWFDYVMDAYAGERNGMVFLAGVPDRPELLPHADEYQGEVEPVADFRATLLRTAAKEGLLDAALRELLRLRDSSSAEAASLSPNDHNLLAAYATYGLRASDGTTAFSRFERTLNAEPMAPDASSFIDSINSGWFSVLRVNRIHLDQGLEVFDLLREEKLRISERSATRQLRLGDLMLGWLCKDQAGTLTLEGGLAHLPAFASEPYSLLVAELRQSMPPLTDEQEWKRAAADLPLPLLAGILELRAAPPMPQLLNTSGDPLDLATGHYRIRDHARVVAALRSEFSENGDGSYDWVDDNDTVLAHLELSSTMLRARVNSRQRLEAVQQRLEALLGDAVERSLDVHESVEQALRERQAGSTKARPSSPPLELPPEVAAQLSQVVLAKIRTTLDDAIPQFKGKTLRQLARSKNGRPDAISWLREQERILRSNPQLAGVDMRPLWQELGLPFQGLETDPSR